MPMLTCFNLLNHVDSTAPPEVLITSVNGSSSSNPSYIEWQIKDQKFLGVLFSNLTEEAMAEVVDCTTSRTTWLALEAAFSHSSTSRANQLHQEQLSLRRGSTYVQWKAIQIDL